MAITLETLLVELKANGAALTKQQIREVKQEARELETALSSLGTLGGITYLLTQVGTLLGAFAEVSGINIAAQFRGVAISLEAVTRSATTAAKMMREIKDISLHTAFD